MYEPLTVKRDTGRFDKRTWYIDGYASHWFSTQEDAEAAAKLAGQVSVNEVREMGRELSAVIDRLT